jgi:hypothetical protein
VGTVLVVAEQGRDWLVLVDLGAVVVVVEGPGLGHATAADAPVRASTTTTRPAAPGADRCRRLTSPPARLGP